MKKIYLAFLPILILLTGCAVAQDSGDILSQTFDDLEHFNAIHFSGSFNVTYRESEEARVVIDVQENILENLEISVSNSLLRVRHGNTVGIGIRRTTPDILSQTFDDLEHFNAIHFSGSFNVTYRESEEARVVIDAQENVLENLEISASNGLLRVRHGNTIGIGIRRTTPKVYVYTPYLVAASFDGSVTVNEWDTVYGDHFTINVDGSATVTIPLEVDYLSLTTRGSSTVTLSGNVNHIDLLVSGSGSISASNLQTSFANIELTGSGEIDLAVMDHLDVVIDGSGTVRYKGNPTINQETRGSASLIQIND